MIPVRDSVPSRSTPIAMWILIGVNAAVFFFEMSLPEEQLEALFYDLGLVPAKFAQLGSMSFGAALLTVASLITNAFLHGGWMHVIGNMWSLYLFGDNVEDRMGPGRFTAFYLLTAVAAGAAHLFMNWGSEVPAVGASGAISAVMGAYLFMFPAARLVLLVPIFFLPYFFRIPAVLYLGGWFVIQFFQGTMTIGVQDVGGVAFWAHIGGFVAGVILFGLFLRPKGERRRLQPDEGALESAWWHRLRES
jgi:membrane associated rhomboid family serine protease